jgi:hypothetical protein
MRPKTLSLVSTISEVKHVLYEWNCISCMDDGSNTKWLTYHVMHMHIRIVRHKHKIAELCYNFYRDTSLMFSSFFLSFFPWRWNKTCKVSRILTDYFTIFITYLSNKILCFLKSHVLMWQYGWICCWNLYTRLAYTPPLVSCRLRAWLILPSCRCRQCVPQKSRQIARLRSVTSQSTALYVITPVNTSNPELLKSI